MAKFYTNVTSSWKKILHTYIDDNGVKRRTTEDFYPKVYVDSKVPTKYKNISGGYVAEFKPGNLLETRNFYKQNKDVANFKIYGLDNYNLNFISENYNGDSLSKNYDTSKINITYIDIETDSSGGFIKPEIASAEITAITMKNNQGLFVTLALNPYDNSDIKSKYPEHRYIHCKTEEILIKSFINIWRDNYPDIVSGWNVKGYDIVYICSRIINLFDEETVKLLSPWGDVKYRKKNIVSKQGIIRKTLHFYDIIGISTCDYLDLYKKYGPPGSRESYKLDFIAELEIGENKHDYSQYESLHEFYEKDFKSFIDYNIQDVLLIERLEAKLNLINLCITLAYDCMVNFEDIFYQTRMWDALSHNELKSKNIVTSPRNNQNDDESEDKFEGAYVKIPIPGRYKWVVSLDAAQLYPSLMMMFNISPDVIIKFDNLPKELQDFKLNTLDKSPNLIDDLLVQKIDMSILKKHNVSMTANGVFFSKDKVGFLPEILNRMSTDRAKYKKKYLETKKKIEQSKISRLNEPTDELELVASKSNMFQTTKKVGSNSAFGALGNEGYRYFDLQQAEGITLSGQLVIKWVADKCNTFINNIFKFDQSMDNVIYVDTDSVFFNFEKIIEMYRKSNSGKVLSDIDIREFLVKLVENKIQPFIDKECINLQNYMNCRTNNIFMKLEKISDVAIWSSKKRYALNVLYDEGVRYDTPTLKIVGMSVIKTDTPKMCRDVLRKSVPIILSKENKDLIKLITDFKKVFVTLDEKQIGIPKTVNILKAYADKTGSPTLGAPINTKASLLYNKLIRKFKLLVNYPEIVEGDKIKYVYLKQPNQYRIDSIAFLTHLPKELDLHSFIDYDKMFEKTFLNHLEELTNCVNWKLENKSTLESFFG